MATKDDRIDEYISNAADFARPILMHLRASVHNACPQVIETIKWGFPHFEYNGKILCSMAGFKEHCAFGFRLGSAMNDPNKLMRQEDKTGMGHFGRIKSLKDLPSGQILGDYIREAMTLTDEGFSRSVKRTGEKKELQVPEDFLQVLKNDNDAYKNFQTFSYSHRKEYLEWIREAKAEKTRQKRIATAVEWLREGKGKNWKYEGK